MEALRYVHLLAPGGRVITSTEPFVNIPNYPEFEAVLAELAAVPGTVTIAAEAIAKEVASPRSSNMALLGAAAPYIGLPAEVLEEGIRTIFGAKGEKIVENNLAAFRAGMKQGR